MKRLLLTLALAATAVSPSLATWSIVCVDRATGEVAVATATCIANFDIQRAVPVLVVGKGAGAVQASGDAGVTLKAIIFEGLLADQTPSRIMNGVKDAPGIGNANRQYGIAGMQGPARKFTGINAGEAAPDTRGEVGTIFYAMQGNVLAGDAVIDAAEAAFVGTSGDLSQRVMAAMEAARAFGGDGRCSCSFSNPTQCGSPPPVFERSAHNATIVLARLGDIDGDCVDETVGCVNGDYFLNLNVFGPASDPEPVLLLQEMYDDWRASLAGVPDHVLTDVSSSGSRLPADGWSSTEVEVQLVDIEGQLITTSAGLDLQVTEISAAGNLAQAGAVTNLGDGRFRFAVTAGLTQGLAQFELTVTGAGRNVRLARTLDVPLDPVRPLNVGERAIYAYEGDGIPFVLNAGSAAAGLDYRIYGSASGTLPGTPWDGGTLPLNVDRFFGWIASGRALFEDEAGTLDAQGRAQARLDLPPGLMIPFIGGRLDFCAVIDSDPDTFTNVVGFPILP